MVLDNATARHCQAKAAECAQLALVAGSSEVAEMYLEMQRRWLGVAVKAEATDLRPSNID
jgi:hypothetical protein